jgi:hypothetical protein
LRSVTDWLHACIRMKATKAAVALGTYTYQLVVRFAAARFLAVSTPKIRRAYGTLCHEALFCRTRVNGSLNRRGQKNRRINSRYRNERGSLRGTRSGTFNSKCEALEDAVVIHTVNLCVTTGAATYFSIFTRGTNLEPSRN